MYQMKEGIVKANDMMATFHRRRRQCPCRRRNRCSFPSLSLLMMMMMISIAVVVEVSSSSSSTSIEDEEEDEEEEANTQQQKQQQNVCISDDANNENNNNNDDIDESSSSSSSSCRISYSSSDNNNNNIDIETTATNNGSDNNNNDDDDDNNKHHVNYINKEDDDDEEVDEEEEEDDDDVEDTICYDNIEVDGCLVANIWGKPQVVEGGRQEETFQVIEATKQYMLNEVYYNSEDMHEEETTTIILRKKHCRNRNVMCSSWASKGECEKNYNYMLEYCSPACLTCHELLEEFTFVDDEEEEDYDYDYDYDENNEDGPANPPIGCRQGSSKMVPIPWGVPQDITVDCGEGGEEEEEDKNKRSINNQLDDDDDDDGDDETIITTSQQQQKILELMIQTKTYMMETVYVDEEYNNVYDECENRSPYCSYWATLGECETNSNYMKVACSPACQSCEYIDYNVRCPLDPNSYVAWPNKGDVNKFFEGIVNNTQYWEDKYGTIQIWSQPSNGGPWLISIDDFLSPQECDRLIEFGKNEGYERSQKVDKPNYDGRQTSVVSDVRTSENTWCPDECQTDPITGPVYDRVENLTGIPDRNAEWWQLLRYKPGQYYLKHDDFIRHEQDHPQGPRILTVFFYLNNVKAGGGTRFTKLNITVMPKRGRAVLWPNVLNSSPMLKDKRAQHEALVVEAGKKYGANVWFHQRDFKSAYDKGCT